jgi:predicted permease
MWAYSLREAWAALRTRPLFFLSVVSMLSVTLGVLLCMVNLNQVLLLKALPYPHADRLTVGVGNVYSNHEIKYPDMVAYPMAEQLERHAAVEAVALVNFEEQIVTNIAQRPKLRTTNATPRYFEMLGASFAKGRPFAAANGIGSKEPVAILSYETWQRYFAGSDNILDEKVVINDVSFRIIGVTARDFTEPELFQVGLRTHIWLPWEFNTFSEVERKGWWTFTSQLKILALLKPGQSAAQAKQSFESLITERFRQETQGSASLRDADFKFQITPLKSYLTENGRVASLLFLASSCALAMIACVNVLNLLLARAAEQQRQLAIRATLGADKRHIFGKVLAEQIWLMSLSVGFALLLAALVTYGMKAQIQNQLPRMSELQLSPVTVLVAVLLVIALSTAFAGIVTHAIDYRRLAGLLNSSGKGAGLQVSTAIRRLLIISQIAMAAFLLVAITSVLRVSYQTATRDPDFRVDNVVFASVSSGSMQPNREERIRYIDEIQAKLMQLPQVLRVSNSTFVPMTTNRWMTEVDLDPAGTESHSVLTNLIDEQYLPVMGHELIRGSNFGRDDVNQSARKVLVSESLARKLSPSAEVIGKRIYWVSDDPQPKPYEVIGVVKDAVIPRSPESSVLYVTRSTGLRFVVEVKAGQVLSREEFLSVLNSVHKSFNLYDYETVRDSYDQLTLKDRFIVWVAVGLGALTVMLASLGIYGVLSYGIQLRRYELGIRMAIGAGPARIVGLIYQENLQLFLTGSLAALAVLLICAWLLAKFVDYRLPLTLGTGTFGYFVVITSMAVACYLSLRAIVTRWPVFALRTDS